MAVKGIYGDTCWLAGEPDSCCSIEQVTRERRLEQVVSGKRRGAVFVDLPVTDQQAVNIVQVDETGWVRAHRGPQCCVGCADERRHVATLGMCRGSHGTGEEHTKRPENYRPPRYTRLLSHIPILERYTTVCMFTSPTTVNSRPATIDQKASHTKAPARSPRQNPVVPQTAARHQSIDGGAGQRVRKTSQMPSYVARSNECSITNDTASSCVRLTA